MTQNNDFGAAWTEGWNKLSHNNVFGALLVMPNSKHPWQVRVVTYIHLPTTWFPTGALAVAPQHVQIICHSSCSRPIVPYKKSKRTWETIASPSPLGFPWPPPHGTWTSQRALRKLWWCFSRHTLFCLYFYLCLISLKRDENCQFHITRGSLTCDGCSVKAVLETGLCFIWSI